MRELSSSGTFNRDLMEYSFGNGTTCLLNLSGDTPNTHHLNQRNQGIRISFDFAAANDMNLVENSPNVISNCSTRQPSIASGFEIPILPTASQKHNRQLSSQNVPKINKELLTVQTRQAGRSISSGDLIYVNAMEVPSSGCSGESTLSAPEQHGAQVSGSASSSTKYLNKSSNQSSIRNKFKLSKYKKKKMKAEQQMEKRTMKRSENDENLNETGYNASSKERVFLSVKECGAKKSSSYLSLLRRSTKRKNKKGQSKEM